MKEIENGWFHFELGEILRVNQLIRGEINLAGFKAWYEQLSQPEQCAFIYQLVEFAYQAGVDEGVWRESLDAAALQSGDLLVEQAAGFLRRNFPEWSDFHDWLRKLPDSDRLAVFTLSVYLFGIAEGRVYRNEEKAWCNHWWHRDLLDERVVQDILNNPKFYMTSMKDDDRIKGKG